MIHLVVFKTQAFDIYHISLLAIESALTKLMKEKNQILVLNSQPKNATIDVHWVFSIKLE